MEEINLKDSMLQSTKEVFETLARAKYLKKDYQNTL